MTGTETSTNYVGPTIDQCPAERGQGFTPVKSSNSFVDERCVESATTKAVSLSVVVVVDVSEIVQQPLGYATAVSYGRRVGQVQRFDRATSPLNELFNGFVNREGAS